MKIVTTINVVKAMNVVTIVLTINIAKAMNIVTIVTTISIAKAMNVVTIVTTISIAKATNVATIVLTINIANATNVVMIVITINIVNAMIIVTIVLTINIVNSMIIVTIVTTINVVTIVTTINVVKAINVVMIVTTINVVKTTNIVTIATTISVVKAMNVVTIVSAINVSNVIFGSDNRGDIMQIIGIINQKGGVGKTTTAAATAAILLEKKKRVLVVDMDAQCNLSNYYGLDEGYLENIETTFNCLTTTKYNLKNAIIETEQGDIVPSSIQMAGVESIIMPDLDRHLRLKQALHSVENDYDYVILDTPPALGIITINALTAADYVVIPALADRFSMQGINQVVKTIELVKETVNPKLKIAGILMTSYQKSTSLQQNMQHFIKELGEQLNIKTFENMIRFTVMVKEAQAQRQSLIQYAKHKDVTYDYRKYVDELLNVIEEEK